MQSELFVHAIKGAKARFLPPETLPFEEGSPDGQVFFSPENFRANVIFLRDKYLGGPDVGNSTVIASDTVLGQLEQKIGTQGVLDAINEILQLIESKTDEEITALAQPHIDAYLQAVGDAKNDNQVITSIYGFNECDYGSNSRICK